MRTNVGRQIVAVCLFSTLGGAFLSGCDLSDFGTSGTSTVRRDRDWDNDVCGLGGSNYDNGCLNRRRADRNACGHDDNSFPDSPRRRPNPPNDRPNPPRGRPNPPPVIGGPDIGPGPAPVPGVIPPPIDAPNNRNYNRRVCTQRPDFNSRSVPQCYEFRECLPDNHFRGSTLESDEGEMLTAKEVLQTLNAQSIAYDYLMKPESVQTVIDALSSAMDGHIDALQSLGFQEDDLKALGHLNLAGIADQTFVVLGNKLDATPVLAKGIVARFILTAQKLQTTAQPVPE